MLTGVSAERLLATAVAANEAPSLDEALALIVEAAYPLTQSSGASIVIWEERLERGVVRAGAGSGVRLVGAEITPGDNAPYRAASSGAPVVAHSPTSEGFGEVLVECASRLDTLVSVPLQIDGFVRATFQVGWFDRPDDETIDLAVSRVRTLSSLTRIAYRAEAERQQVRQRARLEAVIDSVPQGIWVESDEGERTVNRAARELLGIPEGAEAPPKTDFELRDPSGEPIPDERRPFQLARTTGRPASTRVLTTRFDGEERILDVVVAPVTSADGDCFGHVAVFDDVTVAHDESELTKHFHESLFETLPIAVLVSDSATREILSVNQAALDLLDRDADEVVGCTPPFAWWADELPAEAASGDEPTSHEGLFRRKDGTLVPVEIRTRTVRGPRSESARTVAIVTDLSHRRQFEQQMIQAGKLAAIGELAAGVAHEINNPLFAILGLVEFLLRDADPTSRDHERLVMIQQTGLEIKDIVRSLLDFARERPDEHGLVALSEVFAEAMELVRRTSSAKGIEIVERYDDEHTEVWGSPNQLKQIVLNLVSNAQQAMPDVGTITITVAPQGETVVASVTDSGTGIPEHVLPRIFEPFYTTKRKLGGTGLGLAVCHGIAETHGGELRAENVPGAGARFELRLPAFTSRVVEEA